MSEENLVADATQAVEAVSPAPDVVTAPDVEPAPETAEPTGDDKRNRTPARERIGQLTRQKRELEAEVARLRASPPKEADFTDYSQYEQAKLKHSTREAIVEVQTERLKAQDDQIDAVLREEWTGNVAAFRSSAPDFDAVVASLPSDVIDPIAPAIVGMGPDGPALAYHLAKNPHEAARLASLPPRLADVELGRMAERLRAPARRTVSSAPPPVAPVIGSGGPVTKDPSQMTQAEYRAWRMGR